MRRGLEPDSRGPNMRAGAFKTNSVASDAAAVTRDVTSRAGGVARPGGSGRGGAPQVEVPVLSLLPLSQPERAGPPRQDGGLQRVGPH